MTLAEWASWQPDHYAEAAIFETLDAFCDWAENRSSLGVTSGPGESTG